MNDQTPDTAHEESPEVLAYFTDEAPKADEPVEVTPEEKPDKAEEVSEDVPSIEDDANKHEEHPTQTYLVAGREVPLEEAIKLVNSISGDNTRLAGAVKEFQQKALQEQQEREKIAKELEEARTKLKSWDDYGTTPEAPTDIAKVVEQVKQELTKEQQQKTMQERQASYTAELDELVNFADYTKVLPKMQEIAEELGDKLHSVSPKKLYKMARGLLDEPTSVSATVEKMVAHKTAAELAKQNAKKVVGGGSSNEIPVKEEDISPEVQAYFNQ